MKPLIHQSIYPSVLRKLRDNSALAWASIGDAYAEIIFLQGKFTGFLLLIVTLHNPNIAVCGLIAVFIAFLFAIFLGLKESFLTSGYFIYNSLLVGFSIGFLFKLSIFVIFLLSVSAILTFLLALMISRLFYLYLNLPILSIPFTVVSSLIYLASAKFPNVYVTSVSGASNISQWVHFEPLEHYLIALGSIVFLPHWLPGLMMALILFCRSRIVFMFSVGGYFLGVWITSLLIGSWNLALVQSGHFNFILIAIALGSIFTIVSLRSIALAAIGVAVSTLIMGAANVFWAQYAIPIFTLPFILITLSMLYALRLSGRKWTPSIYKSVPEETLEHHLISANRIAPSIPIGLPFEGQWSVWQGFDGKWTHTGAWRYAYDFTIKDERGKTYRGLGKTPEQYYAFKKPVYSPVRGKVIAVVNTLPDNAIGVVDSINNWGNYVILWDERGIYVEISHFATGSIAVYEGQWIGMGDFLGLCGNSGYSPEPHIHIQVQSTHWIGAHTIPFCFHHYQHGDQYYAFGLPLEGENILRTFPNPNLSAQSVFLLGELLSYDVYEHERFIENITIIVRLEQDGTFYFSLGESKLYFCRDENQFRCLHLTGESRYLTVLYIACCHIPFTIQQGSCWEDVLQRSTLASKWSLFTQTLKYLFLQSEVGIKAQYQLTQSNVITGSICTNRTRGQLSSEVVLDKKLKFKSIRVDSLQLRRAG